MPESYQNRYKPLLHAQNISAEKFVRDALGLLEADLRVLALLSIQEWASTAITAKDLFHVIGRLQTPSWGDWNSLLVQLRKLHNKTLATADKKTKILINKTNISSLLALLDENIKTPETVIWLRPLFQVLNPKGGKLAYKISLQRLLTAPITQRNRIAHDAPRADDYWQTMATHLQPLLQWFDSYTDLSIQCAAYSRQSPWFIQYDNEWLSYNGLNKSNNTVRYLSSQGISHESVEQLQPLLEQFYRLMGKTTKEQQHEKLVLQFNKEFGKLAAEKLQGVFIGDFLVGKKVGEGGHATVHKGIQLSTGRTVAIKMLKDGLDTQLKQRFKQEANILSRFNRADIVNVIAYGEDLWQRPRHITLDDQDWYQRYFKGGSAKKTYMALEWVEGKTLVDYFQSEEKIDYKQLTRWFMTATEALARVHEDGYIHRDIKPSNIMINFDGQLKLMDFGIARTHRTDRTLFTTLGTQLGTYVYMSPEQIVLEDAVTKVGFATDIYGLSATFYELYTQQRLYSDVKTGKYLPAETIANKKQTGEPPLAPKKIIDSIAWELDIILRGGLENDVADRYKSMNALRRDLQHYLRNEPIEYKQPSIIRRTQLAYRRHRQVMNVMAIAVVIIIGLSLWYVNNLKMERDKAEQARQKAVDERERAIGLIKYMNIELRDKLKPIGQLTIMENIQKRINQYFTDIELNKGNIDELHSKALNVQQHAITLINQGKIKDALSTYEQAHSMFKALANSAVNHILWQNDLPISHDHMAHSYKLSGETAQALTHYKSALTLRQSLVNSQSNNLQWRYDLSLNYEHIAHIYTLQGDTEQALKQYEYALSIRQTLTKNTPDHQLWQHHLSISYDHMADTYKLKGQTTKAFEYYKKALAIRQNLVKNDPKHLQWQRYRWLSYENIMAIAKLEGSTTQAQALISYQKALKDHEKRVKNKPNNIELRDELLLNYEQLADIYKRTRQNHHAEKYYQYALNLQQTLVKSDPSNALWQHALSISYSKLADFYKRNVYAVKALKHYQQALSIQQILVKNNPSYVQWQYDLSISHNHMADSYKLRGQDEKALEQYRKARTIRQALVQIDVDNRQWQYALSKSHSKIAAFYQSKQQTEQALKHYRKVLKIGETLIKIDPSHVEWQGYLSANHRKIAELYKHQQQTELALKHYQQTIAIEQMLVKVDPKNTQWQYALSVSHNKIAELYKQNNQLDAALEHYKQALTIHQILAKSKLNTIQWQKQLPMSYDHIATIYHRKGETKQAVEYYQQAINVRQKLAKNNPNNLHWQHDLMISYLTLVEIDPADVNNYLQQGLKIVQRLKKEKRLLTEGRKLEEKLEEKLLQRNSNETTNKK